MSNSSSKKIPAYLQGNNDLQSLLAKAKALAELNQKISAYIEPHLAPYCHVANLSHHRLILLVANGSIATQLRFQTTDLLRKFKQHPDLQQIKEIHCKVRPPITAPSSLLPQRKVQYLSLETADIIQRTADSLTDPLLKNIMSKIAKHVATDSKK